jgi:hypothetical protein
VTRAAFNVHLVHVPPFDASARSKIGPPCEALTVTHSHVSQPAGSERPATAMSTLQCLCVVTEGLCKLSTYDGKCFPRSSFVLKGIVYRQVCCCCSGSP